jgi:hypothetical protein
MTAVVGRCCSVIISANIRVKNTVNYFAKSYMDFSIGALAMGSGLCPNVWRFQVFCRVEDGNSIIGWSGWFLTGDAQRRLPRTTARSSRPECRGIRDPPRFQCYGIDLIKVRLEGPSVRSPQTPPPFPRTSGRSGRAVPPPGSRTRSARRAPAAPAPSSRSRPCS